MAKKDERNDTVTHLTKKHATFCPLWAWVALVQQIWSYSGTCPETPVSAVWRSGKIQHVTSCELVEALRSTVIKIGEDSLGFKADNIGTHSIRLGSAMAMYLEECPVYTIMMIGCWSSDAFLCYIQKQIEQFSHNVAQRMCRLMFHRHIPQIEPHM